MSTVRRMMVTAAIPVLANLALVVVPSAAAGQLPEEFNNLKVLPEDISQRELLNVMRGFALGLGVRCQHCHVGDEAVMPLSDFDFESDEKETKRKARFMLQMVNYLNEERLPGLAEVAERADPPIRVTCETCHHGLPLPRPIGEILVQTVDAEGIDATVAKYRELRDEFYGSASYDFSELALMLVAGELAQAQNPEAALAMIELNLEHYPESVNNLLFFAQLNMRSGDTEAALEAVHKALEIDPENRQAARLLSQLEGS